jgi:predicted nuclease of restriction endonuclease-like (RecB) superfamily
MVINDHLCSVADKKRKVHELFRLEDALKANMEKLLLELGRGFAFIGRQYIVPIGARRFKVDLVFYHTILKCYVLIDLKRNEIKHSDIGQISAVCGQIPTLSA